MLPKSVIALSSIRFVAVLCSAFIVCVVSFNCAAQSKLNPKQDRLPRVGTIKDYPATGLMTGCGNLYFYRASQVMPSDASYVFLARGDGSSAWMNLGGRDVRLQQVKSVTREGRKIRRYRFGALSISVVIENFKPGSESMNEDDPMLKMRITLRKGRVVRVVRAVGDADC